ncbi:hypothetical protein BGX21_005237, partial [Mortierella sp. AD011]
MAFGVVYQDIEVLRAAITGRVSGYVSSTKADLAGLLAAIMASPRDTPTTIRIDNSAVVSQFKTLEKKVNVERVKGHANSQGNIAVDNEATLGHNSGLWELKDSENNDIECHARLNDRTVESDLRRVLERQSAVWINAHWSEQNWAKENISNWRAIDWKATLHIIHNGNSPRELFTNPADCQERA